MIIRYIYFFYYITGEDFKPKSALKKPSSRGAPGVAKPIGKGNLIENYNYRGLTPSLRDK